MKKIFLIIFAVLMTSSFLSAKKNDLIEQLKQKPAKRLNGQTVKFEEIEIFSCTNFPNNHYLFNKKQNDICLMASSTDESFISSKLGGSYWGNEMVFFEKCPSQWMDYKLCDPKKIRKF